MRAPLFRPAEKAGFTAVLERPVKFRTEGEFIAYIRSLAAGRAQGLVRGIGDDAALIRPSAEESWCITVDLLQEGVHFDLRFDTARSVGHKALAAGLSDVASMGARPRFALVSIAVPPGRSGKFLPPFYRGFLNLADRHKLKLIGGDTSRALHEIVVDVVVLGSLKKTRGIFRNGARVGDRIFVSGMLGKAAWGLDLLRSGKVPRNSLGKQAIQSHRFPTPRSALGAWLGQRKLATAMIDVSDGLSTDLHHLCDESGVGAKLIENRIPLAHPEESPKSLMYGLSGGEDYELLFTVNPARSGEMRFYTGDVAVAEIGEIVPRQEKILLLTSKGTKRILPASGWDHFR